MNELFTVLFEKDGEQYVRDRRRLYVFHDMRYGSVEGAGIGNRLGTQISKEESNEF